jgi:cytochrome c oxidase cbb3-type subunit 2
MVRDIETDRLRFGAATRIEDDIYEHPNLWGSMRNGPDLANVGLRYSADWQRQHLRDPRSLVPESIMPAYPWLIEQRLNTDDIEAKMKGLRRLGVPYTDEDIAGAQAQLEGKTKADALVAYLVHLGTDTVEGGPQ